VGVVMACADAGGESAASSMRRSILSSSIVSSCARKEPRFRSHVEFGCEVVGDRCCCPILTPDAVLGRLEGDYGAEGEDSLWPWC
jgi:hypothetical protein